MNEKEWKYIQDQVIEKDATIGENLGVNHSVATLIIDMNKDYSDVLF